MRRAVLAAVLLAAVLHAAAPAAAASRATAVDAYLRLQHAESVPAGWTGDTASCSVGTESAASTRATRTAVNALRDVAGLEPVRFDPDLNAKALAAATMMAAAGRLSHDPDPGWPCHSADGDEAAGRSNLYLGRSGAAAVAGYVEDAGVDSLGHRRWLLDPRGAVFGTGSTGRSNALLVMGGGGTPPPVPPVVAWPPAGQVPWPLVFDDWSAAFAGDADLSGASVAVTVDGVRAPVREVSALADGYGTGRTLRWRVALPEGARRAARTVVVAITGVVVDGAPRDVRYTVAAFPLLAPLAAPFTATRTARAVGVRWRAAPEPGVPVTGYRIVGSAGSRAAFGRTVGPGARRATVRYTGSGPVAVAVVPLSRVGSPDVRPLALAPPAPRVAAALRLPRVVVRGGRLLVTARVAHRAGGDPLDVVVRGGGRSTATASVVRGRARVSVPLTRRQRAARQLRVTVRYGGSALVLPEVRRAVLRRR